jgi:23S rRNA (adenine2503-C2)-methyltransferase
LKPSSAQGDSPFQEAPGRMKTPITNLTSAPHPELVALRPEELREEMARLGQPAFRGDQLFNWIHARRVFKPEEMSNLSGEFKRLLGAASLVDLDVLRRARSLNSDCEKFLFGLADGRRIEAVWMGFESRSTLCVSTQVGCALDCAFCATATMGFIRHLDASEIVKQVLWVHAQPGRQISNLVFMGMGEPLHNYDQVARALRVLNDDRGMALGRRRMTVSTAGLVPQILQVAEDDLPCRLAVSLNAASDEKRSRLMPINRKYPLDVLFDACKKYTDKVNDRITFEYILMEGVNDSDEDIQLLKARLSRLPSKLNLIYYNQTSRGFNKSPEQIYQRFFEKLQNAPFAVTLRQNMGTDIDAACGQLAVKAAEGEKA